MLYGGFGFPGLSPFGWGYPGYPATIGAASVGAVPATTVATTPFPI